MSDTPLLSLPLLAAAQAQKHVTHNEALLRLDALIHLSVISRSLAAPPVAPADGDRYLVAASPSGAWAGQQGLVALAQSGGWVFLNPRKGWRLWVEAEGKLLAFDGATWREPFTITELANVTRVGVNAAADDVNRLVVSSPATLFNHAGNDHRLKLNKNAAGDTASLLYQSNWSGRAEMGLTGSEDFRINVSGDGAVWRTALAIDRASGAVSLPNTPQTQAPPAVLYAQSLANQGPGFAADTYLAGSAIAIPPGRLKPGTRYALTFDASKTAAGLVTPVITLRFGSGAAVTDLALAAMSFPAQTAAADDGRFTIEATVRATGAAAAIQVVSSLAHTGASGGLSNVPGPVRRAGPVSFDSGIANATIGVSVNAGTGAAWTVALVQARLDNLA
ncbi:MAG: DUF2793 domain-containing protein [Aestuariivirga sp.]|uniref:DUF2793 domain-containing protein n=1 Tax=Aestuariivirga sp. TaxID=2650926 RepID=UPI0025C50A7A|nr:DUF2793 domain-containing protein [Aestuariivirga sp.]MCA3561486.1 DUF2793 domain-containing protein [Aestuariivirga sp.]